MELQKNPKQVTNKAAKGKYKFLQKYYHRFASSHHDQLKLSCNFCDFRGAFYLDEEEDVLKRDTTGATLEDRFDKTVSDSFDFLNSKSIWWSVDLDLFISFFSARFCRR